MKLSQILVDFQIVASRKIAISTEQSYRSWIAKFLGFLGSDQAKKLESSERKVEVFLSQMARDDYSKVSQNQAFNATASSPFQKPPDPP
jgi:site-specific recombinase XerD